MIFKSSEGGKTFTYDNTFQDGDAQYLHFTTYLGDNVVPLGSTHQPVLTINPKVTVGKKGTEVKFGFSGNYVIKNPVAYSPDLIVGLDPDKLVFTRSVSNYDVKIIWDNTIRASFDKVSLDLINDPWRAYIPELKITMTQNQQSYNFLFKKAFFSPTYGLYCKEENMTKGEINLSGFPVTLTKSKIMMHKAQLAEFGFFGKLHVPFVNQDAVVGFYANSDGIQEASVDFDYTKKTVMYQNISGDKCEIRPTWGTLKKDRVEMSGYISFMNVSDPEKNVNVKEIETQVFYIMANGDVGMTGNGGILNWKSGNYNGFKFTPSGIVFARPQSNSYRITLRGAVVLADNLAMGQNSENFSTLIDFDAGKITGGGPPPNQEVGFSSTEVGGGRHDAAVNFDAKFTYLNDDPVYGKGFRSEGQFGIQQPDPMQVHAKMMVARAPGGYNYWFFEAGQENVVQVPTGLLDLGIYGFTGRVYYKMRHQGTNINTDDYVPDGDMFIGVYGLTQLKTLTDNGVKFWGNVSFEVATNGSGLESIKFRGGGEFASGGVGSSGMVRATDCVLEFYWSPKHLYGDFNVTADFMSVVTASANAGFDITSKNFAVWAKGTGYLFGSPSFASGDFGFRCTNKNIRLYGHYNLVDIHKSYDFGICEPSVTLKSSIWADAYVNYSPFQFKGEGSLSGSLRVAGCRLSTTFAIELGAQVMFPSPTCVSAGIEVETPLKDFTVSAGISDGGIFFGKCF